MPSRYSTKTVAKIVEALYCAYALTYDGQFGYLINRNRGKRLSRGTLGVRFEIGKNPGLMAVLADDVSVEVTSTDGNKQIISWTDPDYYEPTLKAPGFRKVGSGQHHKLEFDYLEHVQNACTAIRSEAGNVSDTHEQASSKSRRTRARLNLALTDR